MQQGIKLKNSFSLYDGIHGEFGLEVVKIADML